MSLKAVDEPSTIRASRQENVVVTTTARTGTADLGSTRWRYRQPGRARSREKDHIWREVEATIPTVAQRDKATIIDVMSAAPVTDCTACWKISMNGKPVLVLSAASISPMQKRSARAIPSPMTPLSMMLEMMARGTTIEACWISSDMWMAPSAPKNAYTFPIRPTKTESP